MIFSYFFYFFGFYLHLILTHYIRRTSFSQLANIDYTRHSLYLIHYLIQMINAFSIFFLLLRLKRKKEYCTIAPGMKKIILNACFFLVCMSSNAQKWNQAYQTYIDTYKDVAIEEMERYHIPASITLAQGLFESNAAAVTLSEWATITSA